MNIYYRKVRLDMVRYYHLYSEINDKDLLRYLINNNRLNDYIRFISVLEIDSNIIDIITSNVKDTYYLYELLYYIDNFSDKNKIIKIILDSKDTCIKYLVGISIKDIDINMIIDSIIKDKSSKYLYLLALNIKNINISKIYLAIKETLDVYYIYLFERDILHRKKEDILDNSNNIPIILSYLTYEERLEYLIHLYKTKDDDKISIYKDLLIKGINEGNKLDIEYKNKGIKKSLERE